jgi:hypothetical protein
MPASQSYMDPLTQKLRDTKILGAENFKANIVGTSGNNRLGDLVPNLTRGQDIRVQVPFGQPQGLRIGSAGNPAPYEKFEGMLAGIAVAGQESWVEQTNLGGLAANRSLLVRNGSLVNGVNSAWVSIAAVSTDIYVSRQLSAVQAAGIPFTMRWVINATAGLPSVNQGAYAYPSLTVGAVPNFAADTWPFLVGVRGNGQILHEDNGHVAPGVLGVLAIPSTIVVTAYVDAAGALELRITDGTTTLTHTDAVLAASPTWDAVTFGASTGAADAPFTNGGGFDNISIAVGDLKTGGYFIPVGGGETIRAGEAPIKLDDLAVTVDHATVAVNTEVFGVGV